MLAFVLMPAWACAQDFVGLVHPRHDLLLSVGVAGVVSRVAVEPGRRVAANQLLLVLDDRIQATEAARRKTMLEDQSELRSIEERIRILQPLYEDTRKLVANRGAVSREELARVELDYLSSRARHSQLEAQKRRERLELTAAEQERQLRQLVAPVAGVITRVDIGIGEWAKPGDALVQLIDASTCFLRVNVPPTVARSMRPGTTVPVHFDAAAGLAPVRGTVSYVAPVVDAASGLVELRVSFANPKGEVPPGIKAVLRLDGGGKAK